MDGSAAIERNREALKRILAGLVAIAGLSGGAGSAGHPTTLPRFLYLAVLRLLRPAESAARRLAIALARGLVVSLPPRRAGKPSRSEAVFAVVTMHAGVRSRLVWKPGARFPSVTPLPPRAIPERLALPLLDPLQRPFRPRRRHVPAHLAPRIWTPGVTSPRPLPPPPSRNDPIDATRLGLRLAALGRALDDLPAQALCFARWKARRDRARAQGGNFRLWPLRGGRPPGGRLSRFDPDARRPANIREVDEVLAHAHALAFYALQFPDTS